MAFYGILLLVSLHPGWLGAASATIPSLNPQLYQETQYKKTDHYFTEAVVQGGDPGVNQTGVLNLRRAAHQGDERIVIDLESSRDGASLAVDRLPYHQIAVRPAEKRIEVTIWGQIQLKFDLQKVVKVFQKSKVYDSIEILPVFDEDRWTLVLNVKQSRPVQVFQLTHPARLIIDAKGS